MRDLNNSGEKLNNSGEKLGKSIHIPGKSILFFHCVKNYNITFVTVTFSLNTPYFSTFALTFLGLVVPKKEKKEKI
jgi:hypothetical protein